MFCCLVWFLFENISLKSFLKEHSWIILSNCWNRTEGLIFVSWPVETVIYTMDKVGRTHDHNQELTAIQGKLYSLYFMLTGLSCKRCSNRIRMLPRNWFEPKVLLPFYTMPKVKLMKRKWNEILEVMVSIYTMPSIFPFSYFHLRKAPPSHHSQQHISTKHT